MVKTVAYGEKLVHTPQSVQKAIRQLHADVESYVGSGKYVDAAYYVVVIGSASLMFEGVCLRPTTADIDLFDTNLPEFSQQRFGELSINMRPRAIVSGMPYNYEDRLVEMYVTKHMTTYRASWEDIAYGKLQRWVEKDQKDVLALADARCLDWERLRYILTDPEEATANGISRRLYHELLVNYNDLLARCGQEELAASYIFELLENAS